MNKLVVCKHSKLEWDCKQSDAPRHEMVAYYTKTGANVDNIVASHEYQLRVRDSIFKHLSPRIIMLSEFEQNYETEMRGVNLIISLGGDNSFTRVSHFLDETPLLGICSDPKRSVGYLCSWKQVDIETSIKNLAQKLATKNFEVEDWTRIAVVLDGKSIGEHAINEVFLGEKLRTNMSRYVIGETEYKSSGLLVVTGAGSTGWGHSAGGIPFPPKPSWLNVIHTESYWRLMRDPFRLNRDDTLIVRSLNDDGIVSIDGWGKDTEYKFQRGSVAEMRVGIPLKVLVFPEDK